MQSGVKRNKRLSEFNQKNFDKHMNFARNFLQNGEMNEAWDAFHDALVINYESIEAKSGMKIAGYWKERKKKLSNFEDNLEKGEFLLREYKTFIHKYVPESGINWQKGIKNIEHWVFSTARTTYRRYGELTGNEKNPDILLKQGYCCKVIGDYENARKLLEDAVSINQDSSAILAQLADVYSLLNEEKHSKLFFREAFFLSPQDIDLDSLESVVIERITDELKHKEYSVKELKEWIPVYGTILGIFYVKKELKPIEVGLLKQSIYSLKNQIDIGEIDRRVVIPRLINHYFRLLEHLVTVKGDKKDIDEVLLNIRLLDQKIYDLYLN